MAKNAAGPQPRPLPVIRAEAIGCLKEYAAAPDEQRTPVLRRLAELMVESRTHYARPDGSTDWKGRSHPYRVFVREIYDEAGVDRDDAPSIQAATRYHIGEVLRETLSDDDLEEYGLQAHTPRERAADRRANRTALLHALTARELRGGALLALVAANSVLSQVDLEQLAELDPDDAAVAAQALRDLERRVRQLADGLDADG